ncbi:MAG: VWA domain-containing protein, partial [Firmicutes bacterium]|nr:VWA domain-containing protein [Bacillota bacterium]
MRTFNRAYRGRHRFRTTLVTILAAVVVFTTTYALVLPAITIDDQTAEEEPGLTLEEPVTSEAVQAGVPAEPETIEEETEAPAAEPSADAETADVEVETEPESVTEPESGTEEAADPEAGVTTENEEGLAESSEDPEEEPVAEPASSEESDAEEGLTDETVEETGDAEEEEPGEEETGDVEAGETVDEESADEEVADEETDPEEEDLAAEEADGQAPAEEKKEGEDAEKDEEKADEAEEVKLPAMAFQAEMKKSQVTAAGQELTAELQAARTAAAEEKREAEARGEKEAQRYVIVDVEAEEGIFPAGTTMTVKAIRDQSVLDTITEKVEENTDSSCEVSSVVAFDITFRDTEGNEIEPNKPIRVTMSGLEVPEAATEEAPAESVVVHVDKEGEAQVVEQADDAETTSDEVAFDAEHFSVYAVVYTVDFHWDVDGETFEFSITGGDYVSLADLVEVLGIVDPDTERSAGKFIDNVDSVSFSAPELLSVSKVEEDMTIAEIKEDLGLVCEYSAELTEEQIAEINAQTVTAGDWVLISLKPFDTEEALTVTMKNGEVFQIRVTDAQYDGIPVSNLNGATVALVNEANHNSVTSTAQNATTLQAVGVTVNGNQITTTNASQELTTWTFNYQYDDAYGNHYYTIRSDNGYLNINNSSVTISANPQNLIVASRQSNGKPQIRIGNNGYALNNSSNNTSAGYFGYNDWYNNTNNRGEWFTVYQITPPGFPVRLHFVDENGNPLPATYADGTDADGNEIDLEKLVIGSDGIIDLNQFQVDGYTLSNTHKSTYQDLSGSFIHDYNYGTNNGNYPHTIIGNELKWENNTLQYKLYYGNNDKAGWHWFDAGLEPRRNDAQWFYVTDTNSNPTDYTTTPDNDPNPYDYYLVYSPTTGSGGSGGNNPSGNELGEIGHTKEKTSNYDGTYNLELGVSSKAFEEVAQNHINVLLVIDTSSSMNRRYDSEALTSNPDTDPNSRIYQTRQAVTNFVTDILRNNENDPHAVELELITFDMGARVSQGWTEDADEFNRVVNRIPRTSGTNWAEAIALAQSEALRKDDGDPTYVLFLTDGAPSQYWNSSDLTGYYVSGEGCYLGARDEAREAVLNGVKLYTIFSYGTAVDRNNDYLGSLVDYAYNESGAKDEYRSYVQNKDQLKDTLTAILRTMEKHFGAGDVQIYDGITEMTTVTFEHADPESFVYTIKYKDYTSLTEYTEKTVDISVSGPTNDQRIVIPPVTYTTVQNGELKTITTKETTIKGAEYSGTPSKKVTWKLTKADDSIYLLEDNWTYNVKFKIWPNQDSYDLLAALNNGFLTWGEDFVNGDKVIPASEYMAQIDNTVTPYALRTNTVANVTYKEVTSKTVDGVTTYTEGDPISVVLPEVSGMPLDNTEIVLEKVWNTSLSSEDYDKINSVTLYVLVDPTPEKIAAFHAAYAAYQADPTAENEAAFTETYYYKAPLTKDGLWKATVSIAPGVYDQYGRMNTTGHTYTVMEPEIDGHYELEATPTHPMLNGLTHNAEDPNTIKDMIDVYEYDLTSLDPEDPETWPQTYEQENQKSKYSVANTLKAGINIRKEIVDVPAWQEEYLDMNEFFPITINLYDEQGNPVSTPAGEDGGGALGYRIIAAKLIPEDAVIQPAGAEGNEVTGYTYKGFTYEAQKNDSGEITGFIARGSIQNGTITIPIRRIDAIRIVNVPIGTRYTVAETVAAGSDFLFKEVEARVDKMDGSGNAYPDPEHPGVTNTDEPDTGERIIVPDAENNVWFRNKPKSELAVLDLQKVDQKSGEGLSDAVFQLQVLNSGGSYQPISAVEGFDGIKLDGTALAPHVVETYASAFSTTGTIQHLTDLPNGKYKLVE